MRFFAWSVVALAAFIWRNGRSSLNTFSLADYPASYYAGGDAASKCATVKADGLKFCEDGTFWSILDASGTLKERHILISCDPNRLRWNTVLGPLIDPDPHGKLWLYSPRKGKPVLVTLKDYPKGHDFHPLGLEIYPSYAGNSSNLFVVNHARQRTFIEHFIMSPSEPTTAVWVRSLSHRYFVAPNSIALTSPTSFYVTNDHLMTRRLPFPLGLVLPMAETILALPLGWLGHVSIEPSTGSIDYDFVAFGVSFPNGVALSPQGSEVAVASSSLGQVYIYSRSPSSNALKHAHTVHVPFSADNLMYDDEGHLIVAGHPHFPSLVAVKNNKTGALSPSWVSSLARRAPQVKSPNLVAPTKQFDLKAPVPASSRVSSPLSHDLVTLFQSNGIGFPTSSTGLRDSSTGVLYVTGLYADGLLVCRP